MQRDDYAWIVDSVNKLEIELAKVLHRHGKSATFLSEKLLFQSAIKKRSFMTNFKPYNRQINPQEKLEQNQGEYYFQDNKPSSNMIQKKQSEFISKISKNLKDELSSLNENINQDYPFLVYGKVLQVVSQSNSQQLKSNIQTPYYLPKEKEPLRQTIYNNFLDIVQAMFPNLPNPDEVTCKIIDNYNLKLIQGNDGVSNSTKFIDICSSYQQFQQWKQYRGKDFKKETAEIEQYIISSFQDLSPNMLNSIRKIIENPKYNFMENDNLLKTQKQQLYNKFWKSDETFSKLNNYYKIVVTPETLKFKKQEDIVKIANFLKQSIVPSKVSQLVAYLTKLQLKDFYGNSAIQQIQKEVYFFILKQCPNYIRAVQNKDYCFVEQQLKVMRSLRLKLKALGIHFDLWKTIEEYIMNNQIYKVDKMVQIPFKLRKQLRKWVRQNFKQYYSARFNNQNLESKLRKQLQAIVINQNIGSFYMSRVKNFVDRINSDPKYVDTIATDQELPGIKSQKQNLRNQINLCQNFKKYKSTDKTDIDFVRQNAKKQLYNILCQGSVEIDYEIIADLVNIFGNKPVIQVITQSKNLTQRMIDEIKQNMKSNQVIQTYMMQFEKVQRLAYRTNFQNTLLSSFNNEQQKKALMNHYLLFGKIQIDEDTNELTLPQTQNKNQLFEILRTRINNIKQVQRSNQYKNFRKFFPNIFNLKKAQINENLSNDIMKIMIDRGIEEPSARDYIKTFLDNKYQKKSIQNLMGLQGQRIIKSIEVLTSYQNALLLLTAAQQNKELISSINLELYIEKFDNDPELKKMDRKERQQLIEGLIKKKLDFLDEVKTLTPNLKERIYSTIENSIQYKEFLQNSKPVIKDLSKQTPQQFAKRVKKTQKVQLEELKNRFQLSKIRPMLEEFPKKNQILTPYKNQIQQQIQILFNNCHNKLKQDQESKYFGIFDDKPEKARQLFDKNLKLQEVQFDQPIPGPAKTKLAKELNQNTEKVRQFLDKSIKLKGQLQKLNGL